MQHGGLRGVERMKRHMTKEKLIKIANEEIPKWKLPRSEVMVILWAFIYRVTEGRSIDQEFCTTKTQQLDYQI